MEGSFKTLSYSVRRVWMYLHSYVEIHVQGILNLKKTHAINLWNSCTDWVYCRSTAEAQMIKRCSAVDSDLSHRYCQRAVEFCTTRGANFAKAYPCACPYDYSYCTEQKCLQDRGHSEPLQSLDGALHSTCCFALEIRTLQPTVTNVTFDTRKKETTAWFEQFVQLWWDLRRCTSSHKRIYQVPEESFLCQDE